MKGKVLGHMQIPSTMVLWFIPSSYLQREQHRDSPDVSFGALEMLGGDWEGKYR